MFKRRKAKLEALRKDSDRALGETQQNADWLSRERGLIQQARRSLWSRLVSLEEVLDSAGIMSKHLYHLPGEANVDVAELSAMVHMLADHLGLEWVTVPETSSWEEQISLVQVLDHGLGVLTDICARLDAEGISHEKIDEALIELGFAAAAICST